MFVLFFLYVKDIQTVITCTGIDDLENYLDSIKIPKKLDLFYFFDLSNIFYSVDKQIHTSEFKKTLPGIRLDKIFDFNIC